MLSKIRRLSHPLGIIRKTPLIVPSFSSKGFNFHIKEIGENKKRTEVSDLYELLLVCKDFVTDTMLVSAYDIYHKLIPPPKDFACTDFTFIDSGGYETSQTYDLSGINHQPPRLKDWRIENLSEVLDSWSTEYPAIIVNFDHGGFRVPLKKQIENAKNLFSKHSDKMSNFLIKPEKAGKDLLQIKTIIDNIKELNQFDIIGVTEKELGNSILDRMTNIAKIRTALDKFEILKPIHVFGSLDPVTTVLFYFAGAEIFDGLTWLKYAFYKGKAIYLQNYAIFNEQMGIQTKDQRLRINSLTSNVQYIDNLEFALRDFHSSGEKDFNVFLRVGDDEYVQRLEDNYKTFKNHIKTE